jgi:hypothetical protein
MLSGAPSANIAAPSTFAAIVATTVNVDHLSFSAPGTGLQVNESYRDPQLRAFEQYLLSNLRQTDVTTDHEGVYLFNVNQAAYIIEGSSSDEEKYCTRRRVNKGMHELTHMLKKKPQSNKGETDRHIFSPN